MIKGILIFKINYIQLNKIKSQVLKNVSILLVGYLSSVLIYYMENRVPLWVPVHTITNPLSTQFSCHDLQEIHFDWLLDEYHIIL